MPGPPHLPTGLVFDLDFAQHDPGPGHPESPERYVALHRALRQARLLGGGLLRLPARPAREEDLQLCHTRAYLKTVDQDFSHGARILSTGDTAIAPGSREVALLGAGSALAAVDAVMQRKVRNAFAVVRPPGHHATPSRGMGFCIYNNVAIAARHARKRHGVHRVLIADWDVHHGNGTQETFYRDGSVFFFSTHQWPWYPGTGAADETGEGAGKGATLNVPLPAGAGHAEVVGAFRKKLVPAADGFRPDLVLISAGFDSRRDDPLGRFRLKDDDFAELTSIILEIAERHAGGRVVSVLEGGYNLEGLGLAAVAHLKALRDFR
jgi:acetoin utilization deacetylase AcuC-like enzyme